MLVKKGIYFVGSELKHCLIYPKFLERNNVILYEALAKIKDTLSKLELESDII